MIKTVIVLLPQVLFGPFPNPSHNDKRFSPCCLPHQGDLWVVSTTAARSVKSGGMYQKPHFSQGPGEGNRFLSVGGLKRWIIGGKSGHRKGGGFLGFFRRQRWSMVENYPSWRCRMAGVLGLTWYDGFDRVGNEQDRIWYDMIWQVDEKVDKQGDYDTLIRG